MMNASGIDGILQGKHNEKSNKIKFDRKSKKIKKKSTESWVRIWLIGESILIMENTHNCKEKIKKIKKYKIKMKIKTWF